MIFILYTGTSALIIYISIFPKYKEQLCTNSSLSCMMCQIGFNRIGILLSLSKIHFKRDIVSYIFYNVFTLRILKHTWKLGDLWLTYVQSTQEISDCKSGKKKNNYFFKTFAIKRRIFLLCFFVFFVFFFVLFVYFLVLFLCSSMLKEGKSHYSTFFV